MCYDSLNAKSIRTAVPPSQLDRPLAPLLPSLASGRIFCLFHSLDYHDGTDSQSHE